MGTKCNLGDLVHFFNGKAVKSKSEGKFPVFGSNGKLGFTDNSMYDNGIVVGRVGEYCGSVQLAEERFWASDNTIVLKPQQGNDIYFLHQLLKNIDLNYLAGGSAQPLMTQSILKNVQLSVPSPEEQEVKGRVFKELESQKRFLEARILENFLTLDKIYRFFFYQNSIDSFNLDAIEAPFSLENSSWDPSLHRHIPEGWRVSKMTETSLFNLITPGVKKFDGEKKYLATALVSNVNYSTRAPYVTFANRESRANMQPARNSVWFAKMKNTSKFLAFNADSKEVEDYILSTGFAGLQCTPDTYEYVFAMVNTTEFAEQKNKLCLGATQEAINLQAMSLFPIVEPDAGTLEEFNSVARPVVDQISILQQNLKRLSKFAELLIPTLLDQSH